MTIHFILVSILLFTTTTLGAKTETQKNENCPRCLSDPVSPTLVELCLAHCPVTVASWCDANCRSAHQERCTLCPYSVGEMEDLGDYLDELEAVPKPIITSQRKAYQPYSPLKAGPVRIQKETRDSLLTDPNNWSLLYINKVFFSVVTCITLQIAGAPMLWLIGCGIASYHFATGPIWVVATLALWFGFRTKNLFMLLVSFWVLWCCSKGFISS